MLGAVSKVNYLNQTTMQLAEQTDYKTRKLLKGMLGEEMCDLIDDVRFAAQKVSLKLENSRTAASCRRKP